MPREIENDKAERSLNVESSSVWQQISQELHATGRLSGDSVDNKLIQLPGAEVAQNRPADKDAGLPKLRPLGDTKPISETDPFPTQFPSPYSRQNLVREV
jgi:hypothetical protein